MTAKKGAGPPPEDEARGPLAPVEQPEFPQGDPDQPGRAQAEAAKQQQEGGS